MKRAATLPGIEGVSYAAVFGVSTAVKDRVLALERRVARRSSTPPPPAPPAFIPPNTPAPAPEQPYKSI